jgi:adenine-specific DNA-methyltransferase
MDNVFEILVGILKTDDRFFTEDGILLRNKVYESAMNMDAGLIKLLLSNDATKKHFFTEIDGILVFDKVGFGWIVNNRQFLPDSYTRFKNKVGLINEKEDFISATNNIVLAFPYKDCILVGGQTKDDQKRDEIFYNVTLAPDEVDRLLYPKVLVNAKRYTANGVEEGITFKDSDNLIIKGNNLLAIASLLKRYEGTVKCIYIDVPYNTGNDSFGYNDRFKHSTWLTFMKNRLEIAHKLLHQSGTVAISVDNNELAYLLVLLDEIFGKENRKNIITIKRGSVTGAKVKNPGVVNIVEYVVLYARNTDNWKPNRIYSARGYDDRYNNYILNYENGYENWDFTTVLAAFAKECGIKKSKLKKELGDDYEMALEKFVLHNAIKVCQFATLDDNNISKEAIIIKKQSLDNPQKIIYLERGDEKPYYLRNGKLILFAKDRLMEIDGQLTFCQPITDIWDDVLPNDLHNEGGVTLKKGKKPEKLLCRIIELCTNENELVIDFFAGSGTTGAVSHKMNRHYILCEQMDYIQTTTVERLRNVIGGETRGISDGTEWKGGGSFVYCELARCNQYFLDEIQKASTAIDLMTVLKHVFATGFITSKINPADIAESVEDFNALSLDDKKRFVLELLDKNMLYVNLCDLDDEEYAIDETGKTFTRSFYGLEN